MQTIEELEARHARERAHLEWELALQASLPVPCHLVVKHGAYSMVQYQVEGLSEALDLFEVYLRENHKLLRMIDRRENIYRVISPLVVYPASHKSEPLGAADLVLRVVYNDHAVSPLRVVMHWFMQVGDNVLKIEALWDQKSERIRSYGPEITRRGTTSRSRIERSQPNYLLDRVFNSAVYYGHGDAGSFEHNYLIAPAEGTDGAEMLGHLRALANDLRD